MSEPLKSALLILACVAYAVAALWLGRSVRRWHRRMWGG